MRLIQIVPKLPPRIDGIGDHALRLAERLRERHRIETSFLVCDPTWKGPSEITGFPIMQLHARNGEVLARVIQEIATTAPHEPSAILLQFAPYGYAAKGYPSWIIDGIRRILSAGHGPVITMFHELDVGKRKPWTSAFWIAPLQRLLLQKLARLSDGRVTNTEFHRTKLKKWGINNVSLLPSFSTIGEPSVNIDFEHRERQLIVFGRPWQRMHTYSVGQPFLRKIKDLVNFERIVDIGDPIQGDNPEELEGIPVIRYGSLPSSEVSELMRSSVASLLAYPVPLLSKSSIYGAICAHGTLPFIISDPLPENEENELEADIDYIPAQATFDALPYQDISQFSNHVFERYQSRNSASAAEHIASLMRKLKP